MTEDGTTLSDREKEILQHVAAGLTNREIAQKLSISPNTVKVHLSNIFEKAGVASRTEATLYAIEHRIVDVPGGQESSLDSNKDFRHLIYQFRWVWGAILLLVILILIALSTNVFFPSKSPETSATLDTTERWQERTALPEPRAGLAAVSYDGDIYAIGGEGLAGVSGSVFRYLSQEDRWEMLRDKPTPVTAAEGVLIGEKIYIPGGRDQDLLPMDVLEIYDPRRDTWESGTSLPVPISDYALMAYQGEVFLFGGWDGGNVLNSVWIYNPETEAWREGSPMQLARMNAGGVEVSGKLLLFGGSNGAKQINPIEVYNPSRDRNGEIAWVMEGEIPAGIEVYAVQELANFVFAIGRLDSEEYVVLNYDIASNAWHYLYTGLTHPVFPDTALGVSGEDLILLGGRNAAGEIQSTYWHYTAVYTISIPLIAQ